MSTTPSFTVASSIVLVIALGLLVYRLGGRSRLPGPTPLPFVGNALQIPAHNPERTFMQWADTYGDVIHLRIFSQPMVVLSSLQAACDLLEKRSAIYSDRPRFVLLSELMGWKNASTHVRYGERFRTHRRFIHQTFNKRAVGALTPLQQSEAQTLIEGTASSPDAFREHIRRYAAATILKVTYGAQVTSIDDPYVQLAERAGTLTIQSGTPANSLVDYFPMLRHIPTWAPFSGFKRDAEQVKTAVDMMFNLPYEAVKKQLSQGVALPSMTARLIESNQDMGVLDASLEEDIKGVAGTLYAAAEDTTACVLSSFILAMVLNPAVQRKAQAEIDRVVGRGMVPEFEDRPSLPYCESVIKEVYRWNPPVPLGIPHRLMEDDIYHDQIIPEGCTIIANIYAILKDCPNPDAFIPERECEFDPREIAFGFGRRKCPGKYYADNGVWIVVVKLLAAFVMEGEPGSEHGFQTGFVSHPRPFKCQFIARDRE